VRLLVLVEGQQEQRRKRVKGKERGVVEILRLRDGREEFKSGRRLRRDNQTKKKDGSKY
jgi:hypothetical protein